MTPAEVLYNRLLTLYQAGTITETALTTAVTKGYITEEQKTQIMSTLA